MFDDNDRRQTYFIGMCGLPLFKIGKAGNPWRRLKTLQTANPADLTMIFIIHEDVEERLHVRLERCHFKNEWFRYDAQAYELISHSHPLAANALAAAFTKEAMTEAPIRRELDYLNLDTMRTLECVRLCREARDGCYPEWQAESMLDEARNELAARQRRRESALF